MLLLRPRAHMSGLPATVEHELGKVGRLPSADAAHAIAAAVENYLAGKAPYQYRSPEQLLSELTERVPASRLDLRAQSASATLHPVVFLPEEVAEMVLWHAETCMRRAGDPWMNAVERQTLIANAAIYEGEAALIRELPLGDSTAAQRYYERLDRVGTKGHGPVNPYRQIQWAVLGHLISQPGYTAVLSQADAERQRRVAAGVPCMSAYAAAARAA